jgi:hypothetical protein
MPGATIGPEAEAIREALERVGIAVASLNPDPAQTSWRRLRRTHLSPERHS